MTRFVIAGRSVDLDHVTVVRRLSGVRPEPTTKHAVDVDGVYFPVVQALEVVSGVPRHETRSARARDVFTRLGFRVVSDGASGEKTLAMPVTSAVAHRTPDIPTASLLRDVSAQLTAPRVPLKDLVAHPRLLDLGGVGLYAIYGSTQVWDQLGLASPDDRPLYLGKAEAHSIRKRVLGQHFANGRTGSSTVRRSFAALLRTTLDLTAVPRNHTKPDGSANFALTPTGDARLSTWMIENLELAAWLAPEPSTVKPREREMLQQWSPALNLDHCNSPWRTLVSSSRARMAAEARQSRT